MGQLITQSEAAELRKVTIAAINYLVKMKRIRSAEKYGRILVDRDDVINYKPHKSGRPSKAKDEKRGKKK
jgi:hypothetical protein